MLKSESYKYAYELKIKMYFDKKKLSKAEDSKIAVWMCEKNEDRIACWYRNPHGLLLVIATVTAALLT